MDINKLYNTGKYMMSKPDSDLFLYIVSGNDTNYPAKFVSRNVSINCQSNISCLEDTFLIDGLGA